MPNSAQKPSFFAARSAGPTQKDATRLLKHQSIGSSSTSTGHSSRIPVASYRLRTAPTPTSRPCSSPRDTSSPPNNVSHSSLANYAGRTSVETSRPSSIQSAVLTRLPSQRSRHSLSSTEAIKSPISLHRRSTDAVKSPATSTSESSHTYEWKTQISHHRRGASVSSASSARTFRISGPVFQEASTGIQPTEKDWQEQRRASLECLYSSALHDFPGAIAQAVAQEQEGRATLSSASTAHVAPRVRVLSTAHEADDEGVFEPQVESPCSLGEVDELDREVELPEVRMCQLPYTPTERLSANPLQSRFSNSPGPASGLEHPQAEHTANHSQLGVRALPRAPSRGIGQFLRRPFGESNSSRPDSPAFERELACPSPTLSMRVKSRKILGTVTLNAFKREDSTLAKEASVGVSTVSSCASEREHSRHSTQTFHSGQEAAAGGPEEREKHTTFKTVLSKTGRHLRQRLGSKPPRTSQEAPPSVPARDENLCLDIGRREEPLSNASTATEPKHRPSLPSLPSRAIRPLPSGHRFAPGVSLTSISKQEGFIGSPQAPWKTNTDCLSSNPTSHRRLLSHRIQSKQLSVKSQCSEQQDTETAFLSTDPCDWGISAGNPRDSWVDMSQDTIFDGSTAVNGRAPPRKYAWTLNWKFGRKWRQAKTLPEASQVRTTSALRSPPKLPPLTSNKFLLQDSRMSSLLEKPSSQCVDRQRDSPQRSLLLPAIREHASFNASRPIAALPRRSPERRSVEKSASIPLQTKSLSLRPDASRLQEPRHPILPCNVNRLSTLTSPPLSLSVVTEASPSSLPTRRESPAKHKRSPGLSSRRPRPTDSLPVPPRRTSRARGSVGQTPLSSEASLSSISTRSAGTPGELDFDRDFTKTSARSATTIGSSILFSDVEMALNRLLAEQKVKVERDRALRELTRQAQKLLSPARASLQRGGGKESEWQDDCSPSHSRAPYQDDVNDATFHPRSVQSAEKQLASILIRYLRKLENSHIPAQKSRSVTPDKTENSSKDHRRADSNELGDLTAVTERLQQIVKQFRNTPCSTPSRRLRPSPSPRRLQTPDRHSSSRSFSGQGSGHSRTMLTPERWRRSEVRRHHCSRSSVMASSIGHSLMSYCSTATSSSAEDLSSLLETMMDTSDGEGADYTDQSHPVLTINSDEKVDSPQAGQKRSACESDSFCPLADLGSGVSSMIPLQESSMVFGCPRPGSPESHRTNSQPSQGREMTPLQSILKFYASTEPDWYNHTPSNGSPVSKRKLATQEEALSQARPSYDGSPRMPARILRSSVKAERKAFQSSPMRRNLNRSQVSAAVRSTETSPASLSSSSEVTYSDCDAAPSYYRSPFSQQSRQQQHPPPRYELIVNHSLASPSSIAQHSLFGTLRFENGSKKHVDPSAMAKQCSLPVQGHAAPRTPALQWPLTPPLTDSVGKSLKIETGQMVSSRVTKALASAAAKRSGPFGNVSPSTCALPSLLSDQASAVTADASGNEDWPGIQSRGDDRPTARPLSLSSPTIPTPAQRINFATHRYPPPPALVITDADVEAKFRAIELKCSGAPEAETAAVGTISTTANDSEGAHYIKPSFYMAKGKAACDEASSVRPQRQSSSSGRRTLPGATQARLAIPEAESPFRAKH